MYFKQRAWVGAVLVAASVLTMLFLTVRSQRQEGVAISGVSIDEEPSTVKDAGPFAVGLVEPAPSVREAAAAPAIKPASTGAVEVRATWEVNGPAAEGVRLRLASDDSSPMGLTEWMATDVNGRARFSGLVAGTFQIQIDRAPSVGITLSEGGPSEFEVAIPAGVDVMGRVLEPTGGSVPGAEILLATTATESASLAVMVCADDGSFFLRSVAPGRFISARASGYAPSPTQHVSGSIGTTQRIRLTLEGKSGSVQGTVKDAFGAIVPGANVTLGGAPGPGIDIGPAPFAHEQQKRAGDDGRFQFQDVAIGVFSVKVGAPGLSPWYGKVKVEARGPSELDIRLSRGAVIRGFVSRVEGNHERRVAGAHVAAAVDPPDGNVVSKSDQDGSFRLEGVPPGDVRLEATALGLGEARWQTRVNEGDDLVWAPVLERKDFVAGFVTDESGGALANWTVRVYKEHTLAPALSWARTKDDGQFRIEPLSEDGAWIGVLDPNELGAKPLVLIRSFARNTERLVIVVRDEDRPSAYIHGMLVDDRLRPIAGGTVNVMEVSTPAGRGFDVEAETGAFRLGPYGPGTFSLRFNAPDKGHLDLDCNLEAGQVLDLGKIVLSEPGHIVVDVAAAQEDLLSQAGDCEVLNAEGRVVGKIALAVGKRRSSPVPPGKYVILLMRSGYRFAPVEVEVFAGQEAMARVNAEPATFRYAELEWPAGMNDQAAAVRVCVTDEKGRLTYATSGVAWTQQGRKWVLGGLVPGRFTASVSCSNGMSGSVPVVVSALDEAKVTFPIPMK